MKIYTRTGDSGTTGLIGGKRVDKDDLRIEAVGALDDLNAHLGLARSAANESPLDFLLERLQKAVFEVGSELASPDEHARSQEANLQGVVPALERSIDSQTSMLPELKNFILPGGSEFACRLHVARCKVREAERRLVSLNKMDPVRAELLEFLNRLSDWMFVASRTANHDAGVTEPIWIKEDSE